MINLFNDWFIKWLIHSLIYLFNHYFILEVVCLILKKNALKFVFCKSACHITPCSPLYSLSSQQVCTQKLHWRSYIISECVLRICKCKSAPNAIKCNLHQTADLNKFNLKVKISWVKFHQVYIFFLSWFLRSSLKWAFTINTNCWVNFNLPFQYSRLNNQKISRTKRISVKDSWKSLNFCRFLPFY